MTQHNVIKGSFEPFNASGYSIGIVAAQFNKDISDGLLQSAREQLQRYQVAVENITVHRVPGAVELPGVLKAMAESEQYDALAALGVVIRGATPHFEYVCKFASTGVLEVVMQTGVPVGFGVLTLETHEQGMERLHVGGESVAAALHSAKIIQEEG